MGSIGRIALPIVAAVAAPYAIGAIGSAAGFGAATAAEATPAALFAGLPDVAAGESIATAGGTGIAAADLGESSFLPSWMTGGTARSAFTGLQTGLNILSGNQQAAAMKQQTAYENELLANNENNSMAASSRAVEAQTMQTQRLMGTAAARAAAGGGTVTAPTTTDIIGNIGAEGQYRAMVDLWNGQNQVNNDQNQIALNNFEGKTKENQYQMRGILSGAGNMIQNTFFSKYGNPSNTNYSDNTAFA